MEDILAAVAKRAGSTGLRSFTGPDEIEWELDYTRVVEEVLGPHGALSLERVTIPFFYHHIGGYDETDAATLAAFAAGVPTLREFVVKGVLLFGMSDNVRTLLAAYLLHCTSELYLIVTESWFEQEDEDIGAPLNALGTALSHGCGCRTVDVCCDVPPDNDAGHTIIRATQLVAMLAAMEHQSSLRLLELTLLPFDTENASWITRAAARVNPPVSVRFQYLQCLAMDVRFLSAALACAASVTDLSFYLPGRALAPDCSQGRVLLL